METPAPPRPQAIIMQTSMGMFFKVLPLNGAEWGVSIAIGATAIPVSIMTRALGRFVPDVRRRRKGRRTLSTGRGAGAGGRVQNEALAVALQRRASMQMEREGASGGGGSAAGNPRGVPRLAGLSSIGPGGGHG
jgi:hypothetical protein